MFSSKNIFIYDVMFIYILIYIATACHAFLNREETSKPRCKILTPWYKLNVTEYLSSQAGPGHNCSRKYCRDLRPASNSSRGGDLISCGSASIALLMLSASYARTGRQQCFEYSSLAVRLQHARPLPYPHPQPIPITITAIPVTPSPFIQLHNPSSWPPHFLRRSAV